MIKQLLPLLLFVIPTALYAVSVWTILAKRNAKQTAVKLLKAVSSVSILISTVVAVFLAQTDVSQFDLFVQYGLGLSIRIDALSITMFTMISLLGFIIIRFSHTYLEGDSRQNIFMARLATTIASVQMLVLSGNIAQIVVFWSITSICLHYLLVFYRNRPQAIAAARKKFIVARLGDLSLLIAFAIIYVELGSGDLNYIFDYFSQYEHTVYTLIASVFLVLAALLKSAQFPSHGWLIEMVETPTPVSALLHAGLLNAGPFLMVRMSFLMNDSFVGSVLLILVGGITAIYASTIFLTQPSVKVALGYSSIAHMGFMLLFCGFGVYTAAILHLVAHSFYKAHAFLSSGSVVDVVRAQKVSLPKRKGKIERIVASFILTTIIYFGVAYIVGVELEADFTLMATGIIIVMGLTQIIIPIFDAKTSFSSLLKSCLMVAAVTFSFFTLEHLTHQILIQEVPSNIQPDFGIKMIVSFIVLLFGIVILIQSIAPRIKKTDFVKRLGIHVRNGFYLNVFFDRFIGALEKDRFKWLKLTMPDEKTATMDESVQMKKV